MQSRALVGRQQIRLRFEQMKRSPGLNILGIPELIGLAGAALLALITVFAYFYFLAPAHSRLISAQLERDRLQGQLRASEVNFKEGTDTRATIDKINASLEDFESNWLAAPGAGRMSLYTELNNLIRGNGLRNTSGPTYATLAAVGSKNLVQPTASATQQSNAKWQTIYPGIAVTVTVEGTYQNIRRFVREIETGRQFLIINAVELESVTQSGVLPDVSPAEPRAAPTRSGRAAVPPTQPSGTRGTLVSLRLDMATYFRHGDAERASLP
jgi:hypothetical protein